MKKSIVCLIIVVFFSMATLGCDINLFGPGSASIDRDEDPVAPPKHHRAVKDDDDGGTPAVTTKDDDDDDGGDEVDAGKTRVTTGDSGAKVKNKDVDVESGDNVKVKTPGANVHIPK